MGALERRSPRATRRMAALLLSSLVGWAAAPSGAVAQPGGGEPQPGVAVAQPGVGESQPPADPGPPLVGELPRVDANATIVPTVATIGDRLRLTIEIDRPSNLAVEFPDVEREIAPLELSDGVVLLPQESEGRILESRVYVVSAFETGTVRVPGLGFRYISDAGDTLWAWTDTLFVEIESVLPDTAAAGAVAPRDIKPPIGLPRRIWPFLVAIAIAAAAAVGFWYLRKWWLARRHEPSEDAEPEPVVPRRAAHVVAFERLRDLDRDDPIGRGEIQSFYVAVTEICRRYVRDRYAVDAIDMTTRELAPAMTRASIAASDVEWTTSFLSRADLTKFAKFVPEAERAREDYRSVWDFVERTRFRAEPAVAEGTGGSGESGGDTPDAPVRTAARDAGDADAARGADAADAARHAGDADAARDAAGTDATNDAGDSDATNCAGDSDETEPTEEGGATPC